MMDREGEVSGRRGEGREDDGVDGGWRIGGRGWGVGMWDEWKREL